MNLLRWATPDSWWRGDWFFTNSGKRIYVLAPDPLDINIYDVSAATSKICRFGGHCLEFYSVAQHSVLVSTIVEALGHPELALEALLHDAPEAYLGDVIRPLKRELRRYRKIEALWEPVVARALGVEFLMNPIIKQGDLIALATERRDFAPHVDPTIDPSAWRWKEDELAVEAFPQKLKALSPRDAQEAMLNRYFALLYDRRREAA